MNFDIIICTKDRSNDVIIFLNSLLVHSIHPINLIIIDASVKKSNLIEEQYRQILADTGIHFVYSKTLPGLTRQRNLGYRFISESSEVVFYFDDDIVLTDRFYIEKILERFSGDIKHQIGCIFGQINNNKEIDQSKNKSSICNLWLFILKKFLGLLSHFFLISSSKVYHVLSSGMNTSNQNKTNNECFVDWQPGCCMSFRREVLGQYHFDESLVGYSMREDLDMSFRVSKKYKLLYLPSAQILHLESSVQRLNSLKFGEKDIESWHWFVWKNMNTVKNKIYFCWALTGYLILLLLSSILFNDKNAYYRFKGGLKALFRISRLRY